MKNASITSLVNPKADSVRIRSTLSYRLQNNKASRAIVSAAWQWLTGTARYLDYITVSADFY